MIVRIPEYSRVGDHDRWVLLLPERPVIRPPHTRPVGRCGDSFRRKARRFAKCTDRLPHQITRFCIPHEAYEVATTGIEKTKDRRIFLAARNVGIKANRLKRNHGRNWNVVTAELTSVDQASHFVGLEVRRLFVNKQYEADPLRSLLP